MAIWLNPWKDPKGTGFQIIQASFAFAAGGVAGTGIGLGSPTRIPVAENDFIFAAIGEELGLLGATAILIAYLLMVGAGLRIALRRPVPFEQLLATGLTALLGVQSFIIIAGVTRLLPLTGVTLPFVSYGGSSLVANYVLLALLLRISDDAVAAGEAGRRGDDRQIRRLGIGLMVCFGVLFLQLNRLTGLPRPQPQQQPGQHPRDRAGLQPAAGHDHHRRRRGPRPLGADERPVQAPARVPGGPLFGHVTGYFNFTFGATGVEKTYNDELAGRTRASRCRTSATCSSTRTASANVTLTVRNDVQQVASDALGDRKGSVVALDPRTGADPRPVALPDLRPQPAGRPRHDTAAAAAQAPRPADPTKPLLARSYQERFFPGSTFKVVTSTAALESGKVTIDTPCYPVAVELHAPAHQPAPAELRRRGVRRHPVHDPRRVVQLVFAQMGVRHRAPT